MMVSSSPPAAKKRGVSAAGGISADERVSLIDTEGQPMESNGLNDTADEERGSTTRTNGGNVRMGDQRSFSVLSYATTAITSQLPPTVAMTLTGLGIPITPNKTTTTEDDPKQTKRTRRKRNGDPEDEEFESLLGSVITTDGKNGSNLTNRAGTTTTTTQRRKRKKKTKKKQPETVLEYYIEFRKEWPITRMVRYFGLMMLSATFTSYMLRKESRAIHWEQHYHLLQPSKARDQRCFITDRDGSERCSCPDPEVGLPRYLNTNTTSTAKTTTTSTATTKGKPPKLVIVPEWQQQHDRMVRDAKLVAKQKRQLDIVMLGDSIIELWNGTSSMGTQPTYGRNVFESLFTKAGGGPFDGLALGCEGDTGPNLLWHLTHGVLEPLNPKVWFIYVGSNDLFTQRCTDSYVLANILNVLQELHLHRPDAHFIVHGLLPRRDARKNGTNFLGEYWSISQQINLKISRFCNGYENMHFMQGGRSLMMDNDVQRGRKEMNPKLMMPDGIHPTELGLQKWGATIIKKLNETLIELEESRQEEVEVAPQKKHFFWSKKRNNDGSRRLLRLQPKQLWWENETLLGTEM